MKLEQARIDELNAAEYNPRVDLQPGDPVYENLKLSVETFGYLQPIIVNRRTNTVVGGHQRLKVLKDLGHERVDVVFVDLTPEREKALNLTLNKTVGEWGEPKLARLLQEFGGLPDIDIQLTGFDTEEIGGLGHRGRLIRKRRRHRGQVRRQERCRLLLAPEYPISRPQNSPPLLVRFLLIRSDTTGTGLSDQPDRRRGIDLGNGLNDCGVEPFMLPILAEDCRDQAALDHPSGNLYGTGPVGAGDDTMPQLRREAFGSLDV